MIRQTFPGESALKKCFLLLAFAPLAGGCAAHKSFALTCSEYIGRPISEHIAAYGPPKATFRMTPTTVGYLYEGSETRFVGHQRYYEVNYLTGVDNRRTPTRPAVTTCSGQFIVRDDGEPRSKRLIVDVIPAV